jgi:hypothetical protein
MVFDFLLEESGSGFEFVGQKWACFGKKKTKRSNNNMMIQVFINNCSPP